MPFRLDALDAHGRPWPWQPTAASAHVPGSTAPRHAGGASQLPAAIANGGLTNAPRQPALLVIAWNARDMGKSYKPY